MSADPRWIAVARVGDVAPGAVLAIDLAGAPAVLYRDGDVHYAAQRRCPHAGFDLADGFVSRGHLVCPLHLWRFEVATGVHVDAAPEAESHEPPPPPGSFAALLAEHAWAQSCLITYAVRVVGDIIEVDPTPRRRVAAPNQGDPP